jgi:putative endopeptidase
MKTCHLFIPALILATGIALAQSPAAQQDKTPQGVISQDTTSKPEQPPATKSFDASAMDLTADPCNDFYQYACGNWTKNNPVPSDQVRWARSFSVLRERNRYLLWKDLDAAAKKPTDALQKQYGSFYAACMDTAAIDKRGFAPVKAIWAKIDGLQNAMGLAPLLAELSNHGTPDGFFRFGVTQDDKDSSKQIAEIGQGGISLPDRDYYIVDSKRFKTIRAEYLDHVTKMFVLAGDSPDDAAKEAAAVMEIETAMAKVETSRTEMRNPETRYHIYTVADFEKLAPNFDWSGYFKKIRIGHFDTLNVSTPNYFSGLDTLIASEPLSSWKSYLRWHSMHGFAQNLSQAFFDENFAFFGRTLAGQQQPEARWKQCTSMTDRALGEAVGQEWVKENFPPAAKDSMDKLVAELEKELGVDISQLPWMSDETKKAAEQKLAMIRNKIGYPEHWRDYSSIKVSRTNLIGNVEHSATYERNYRFAKLGRPVDEKEWGMTPPTVNAYYDPSFNDINFPAGILQPPFFDPNADPAVNFGGIGVVIGHEMTHGFDDEGSKYDGSGNLHPWQTPADQTAFNARTECVADEYSGFEAAPAKGDTPAQHLNGHLTLGENTADNGGLRIAFMALEDELNQEGKTVDEKVDGFTEAQRYFLGFAQVWCENDTDAAARQSALTDPHSPGRWRVNGSVQNFDEFGKAFSCKKGTPMYPASSCRVW